MKKKLLYIGHSYHNTTKSTQFLQDFLAQKYDIEKFNIDPYTEDFDKFKSITGKNFDLVVLFQIMPSIIELKKHITFDRITFFPMYDGVPDIKDKLWDEYRECNIINFSKTLHKKCKHRGLSSYYIQYFPKPEIIKNEGDEFSIFLWQRLEMISPLLLEQIVDVNKINTLYLHQAPDPLQKVINPSLNWKDKVKISKWFDTKDELKSYTQQAAIYIAPRHKEGIGMSFLEAMAAGRCVIAPDNPTMNEYITHGKTGFLFDLNNPQIIDLKNIRQIQKNTYEYIQKGYSNWENKKSNILKWVETKPSVNYFKIFFACFIKVFQTIFSIRNQYINNQKRKIVTVLGIKISKKVGNKL